MAPACAMFLWKLFYQQNDQWPCIFGLTWGGAPPVGVRTEGTVSLEVASTGSLRNTRTDGVFFF